MFWGRGPDPPPVVAPMTLPLWYPAPNNTNMTYYINGVVSIKHLLHMKPHLQ